jgi:hypothetical protein
MMYYNFTFISVCVSTVLCIFMQVHYKCLYTANLFTQFSAQKNFCFKHAEDQHYLSLYVSDSGVTVNMTTILDSVQHLEFSQTQYRSQGSSFGIVMCHR